jgi:hypothetical protein
MVATGYEKDLFTVGLFTAGILVNIVGLWGTYFGNKLCVLIFSSAHIIGENAFTQPLISRRNDSCFNYWSGYAEHF